MWSIFRDEEQYNVESYWAHITSSRGRLVGGGNRPKIVHQLGTFTTPNWVCLGGRIGTAKKYDFSLAVLINNQEIYITWRFDKNHQENMQFSWQLGSAAK